MGLFSVYALEGNDLGAAPKVIPLPWANLSHVPFVKTVRLVLDFSDTNPSPLLSPDPLPMVSILSNFSLPWARRCICFLLSSSKRKIWFSNHSLCLGDLH